VSSATARLQQALLNYVGNAINQQGASPLWGSPRGDDGTSVSVRFEVKTRGSAFRREDRQDLHAFEQADSSTTREYGGTGLGLAISAWPS
jgi:signal transduction histidine kinase